MRSERMAPPPGERSPSRRDGGGWPGMPRAFVYLKIAAGMLLLVAVAASVAAGLVFNEVRAYQARLQPETWEAIMMDKGLPHGLQIALCVAAALTALILAAIVYTAAALSEHLLKGTKPED